MIEVIKFYPGETFFTSDGYTLKQYIVMPDGVVKLVTPFTRDIITE